MILTTVRGSVSPFGDININSPVDGEVLTFTAGVWVNGAGGGGGGPAGNWFIFNGGDNFATGAIDSSATATTNENIVIGDGALISGGISSENIVMGSDAVVMVNGVRDVCLGQGSQTSGANSIAIGTATTAQSSSSIAVGFNARADNFNNMAVGSDTMATGGLHCVAIGVGMTNAVAHSLQIGVDNLGDNSTLRLEDSGRMSLQGANASITLPAYGLGVEPAVMNGSLIYNDTNDTLRVSDGVVWNDVAMVGHVHSAADITSGTNTAFNTNFGFASGQTAEGDHNHFFGNLLGLNITAPVDGQILTVIGGIWLNLTPSFDADVLTSGVLDDARVAVSNITQHQAALSITESQISDLVHYRPLVINAQTGVAYTLALSDGGHYVEMNNPAANIITIPTNAVVPFDIGTEIVVQQTGVGQTTFAGAGITFESAGGLLSLTEEYSGATLIKKAIDTWTIMGDLA